jgi:hypothetical protein
MSPPPGDSRHATLLSLSGALGCLLLAGDVEVAVQVSDSDGQSLLLALPRGEHPQLAPERHDLVMLEAKSAGGVLRMLGTAVLVDAGSIRFQVVEVLEVHQRRNFVRVRAPRPIVIDTGPDGPRIDSFALDLSGGGLLLAGPGYLKLGQRATFRLRLDRDTPPIVGTGRVVRTNENGHTAISFDSLEEADRERLIHFIFDRERAERSATHDG